MTDEKEDPTVQGGAEEGELPSRSQRDKDIGQQTQAGEPKPSPETKSNLNAVNPSTSMLKMARRYASCGWPVLPLHSMLNGKCTCRHPESCSAAKHPRTQHGVKDASLDLGQISKWWTKWPDANIGIATGKSSGLLVLDIDPRNDGDESLSRLELEHGPLPSTLTVQSGGGGKHLYFSHPGGKIDWNGNAPGGIDLKADSGYVVAPPSIHKSGDKYRFDGQLKNVQIAGVPDWLRSLICRPDKAIAHAACGVTVPVGNLKVSERINKLIRDGDVGGKYESRSEAVYAVVRALIKTGHNDETICAVLLDPENGLSEKPIEKGQAWLEGEIQRAREKPDEPARSTLSASSSNGGLHVRCLRDVEPEEVEWLWKPYIPIGKVTSIEGDPGIGKSFLTAAIAAMISLGIDPPTGETHQKPCRVLMFSAEDGLGDTLRPRLDALDANVDLIFGSETVFTLTPEGLKILESEIEKVKPKLVIVDPLVAFMGGKLDMNRANQVRELMAGLASIANRAGVAIVTIRHLTKGARDQAIYRGQGSIDITAACRSVLMVGRDPNNDERRVMTQAKSNLAAFGPSISYTIDEGVFRWGGEVDIKAEDLGRSPPDADAQSAIDEAVDFLKELLAEGPVLSNSCISDAKIAKIAKRTLYRAKKQLRVKSQKTEIGWSWELRQDDQGD